MSDILFSMHSVVSKPVTKRGRVKGSSKYAPIIDAFLESGHELVMVDNTEFYANYLCSQLKKVCVQRGLDTVTVSVINKEVYLEKD